MHVPEETLNLLYTYIRWRKFALRKLFTFCGSGARTSRAIRSIASALGYGHRSYSSSKYFIVLGRVGQ